MRFTIVWTKSTENDLAELWIQSSDRQAVSLATDAIEASLRADPTEKGESREEGTRVLFEHPLAISFRVSEPDRVVFVFAVWLTRKRGLGDNGRDN